MGIYGTESRLQEAALGRESLHLRVSIGDLLAQILGSGVQRRVGADGGGHLRLDVLVDVIRH